MDKNYVFWLSIFIAGLIFWFVYNIDRGDYNYSRFPNLVNQTTGKRADLINDDLETMFNEPEDYITKTTAESRLYKFLHTANLFFIFSDDQYYTKPEDQAISGWPVANQTLCGQQLAWIKDQLRENAHYTTLVGKLGNELTNYMDTFGQFQAGTFRGDHVSVGNYRYCLESKLDGGNISNRYCFARFRMKSWPANDHISAAPPRLSFGICIPETCDTNSFEQYKDDIEFLSKYQLSEYHKENLVFENLFCLPDDRSPLRKLQPIGYITLGIMLVWSLIIIAASLVDEYIFKRRRKQFLARNTYANSLDPKTGNNMGKFLIATAINKNESDEINSEINGDGNNEQVDQDHQKKNGHSQDDDELYPKSTLEKLIGGMALRNSVKSFKACHFRVRYNRGERVRVDLASLDFLKAFFMIAILFGHAYLLGTFYAKNLRSRVGMSSNTNAKVVVSFGRFVDTFFVFFGLLATFTLLRKLKPEQLSNPIIWAISNVGIYLRITPVFMLAYMFNRTVMPYIGAGPFWDYGIDNQLLGSHCREESWIKVFPLFGSTGIPPVPSCNPPSWFLVSYSQITLFLPLFTYLLYRLPRLSYKVLLILFLCIVSALNVGYRLYVQRVLNLEAISSIGPTSIVFIDKYENSGYMDTLTRVGGVSIGCFAGYLLHLYSIGQISELPRWLTCKFASIVFLLLHIGLFSLAIHAKSLMPQDAQSMSIESFCIGNMISYTLWPLLNSILIISMVTVHAKHVMIRFMSHPVWHVFNKLALTILLIQYQIILYGWMQNDSNPTDGSLVDVIKVGTFGTFFSVIIAYVIYLFVEAPITHLVMCLMGSLMGSGKARKNHEENLAEEATPIDQESDQKLMISVKE